MQRKLLKLLARVASGTGTKGHPARKTRHTLLVVHGCLTDYLDRVHAYGVHGKGSLEPGLVVIAQL